jgi:ABC-type nitrate/sulfonate/bicarbonate transport system substrate-binding protein
VNFVVMAGMDAGQSLVTRVSSGIKTFADVKGLRLAVNTPASQALLLDVLKLYAPLDVTADQRRHARIQLARALSANLSTSSTAFPHDSPWVKWKARVA